jgi:hypothetical protein
MARRGCQSHIAKAIPDKKADYVLALKGNQRSCATIAPSIGFGDRYHRRGDRD